MLALICFPTDALQHQHDAIRASSESNTLAESSSATVGPRWVAQMYECNEMAQVGNDLYLVLHYNNAHIVHVRVRAAVVVQHQLTLAITDLTVRHL